MRISLSVIYVLTFFVGCGSLTRYISHIQNYVNLVSAYNLHGFSTIDFPPLVDVSQTMDVNIDMSLYAVNGFDEVAGNIELVVAMNISWLDEMSIIQSISFRIEDRAEFLVPFDMIWTPKIVLTNAIGATSDVGDSAYLCRFDMTTKRISWKPRVVVSGSCTPDVTYYPFDKQECDFIYTAWGFKADEILLSTNSDSWSLGEYDESGEWDIDSTSTETYIQDEQSYIKFTLVMTRKPLYFALNILLPILVLCLLNSTVFLLPAESGERVGFSVTCFLTFMVLLNMIMDIMPRSSNPISFLCYYLVVMMSNSGAMTLVTILLMRIYHKPEKSVVPKWLQRVVTFLNCGCAKLRCCVMCCRFFKCTCSCKDQRKCGCKNKNTKPVSDQMLIEITVDKDQNVIEKPVKKTESKTSNDKEANKSSKCCFPSSCVKNDDTSNSKCCCGCILGCTKCKKNDEHTSKDSSKAETGSGSNSLPCFSCFRKRKRQIDDDHGGVKCEADSLCTKKIKTEINNFEGTSCFSERRSKNENCEVNSLCEERVKPEVNNIENTSCSKKENAVEPKTEITFRPACFGRKGKEVKELNKSERRRNGCFPYIGGRPSVKTIDENEIEKSREKKKSEMNEGGNTKCFRFMRKTKVSTLDTTDTDIENDEMIVSTRSEGSKTVKVSFIGKDELDTEETLLQRLEDVTNSTTNKKGTSLNPIGLEEKNNEENIQNEDSENNEGTGVTLKTKSIRTSLKEKEANEREKSKPDKGDTEFEIEIVRKNSSRRDSAKKKLTKPVMHKKVNVALKNKSIRASVKEKRAKEKSKQEKDDTEFKMEIVRKDRSRRASLEEKLPKPVVHEKVNVSQTQRESKQNNMYIDKNSDAEESEVESRSRRASVTEKSPKPVVHEKVNISQKRSESKENNMYIDAYSEESEIDSLADLEEEVTWPEVGRILDTFFFLAFAGGQAFLTVVFLVPLFTGDTKSSET